MSPFGYYSIGGATTKPMVMPSTTATNWGEGCSVPRGGEEGGGECGMVIYDRHPTIMGSGAWGWGSGEMPSLSSQLQEEEEERV